MTDTLTCIYPAATPAGNVECGYDAPPADRFGRNQLVTLQEHLRDEHLHTDTAGLQRVLERSARWVTHPNGTIGLVAAYEPWVDQEYTKIEWALPDGRKWLRAVPEATP